MRRQKTKKMVLSYQMTIGCTSFQKIYIYKSKNREKLLHKRASPSSRTVWEWIIMLFSQERANSDEPSTPVIPRMTQNISAKPDNMLLNEWYQSESDCDRRQHGLDKQTDAVSQMLNTANIPQQLPWLNKMWSHNICLSGWKKPTCSHGHRFIDFSWELKITKAHLKSHFSKVGIFWNILLPNGYYYQPSLQDRLHVFEGRTVSESSFINEENS